MPLDAHGKRASQRVVVIGLDGFDLALAKKFFREGSLPNLARLYAHGACYALDHGRDKFSGLAWEHFSSGQAPHDGGRWSAVTFDRRTYAVTQDSTPTTPFLADLASQTVVFDLPYCNLALAPRVHGITSWGAHDPGVEQASRPAGLHEELLEIFGPYPAAEWIYGFCWPSPTKTRAAGEALVRAIELRTRAALWLLRDRLPEWDLGIVVISESHSAIEPLWHGVDPAHPLHFVESAPFAAAAMHSIYEAIDRSIGDLRQAFPDATLLAVAMHGMGANDADVAAMALLPEILYRSSFGSPYMRAVRTSGSLPDGTPLLNESDIWDNVMLQAAPKSARFRHRLARRLSRVTGVKLGVAAPSNLDWMPATRYAPFWHRMPAFALPSYYDGRIRINVAGRESRGIVRADQYAGVCSKTIEMLNQCTNLLTGEKVISGIYCPKEDPMKVGPTEADLYIVWESAPLGLRHPRLGSIGPVPYRRTGGHTGEYGFLFVEGFGVVPGDRGIASSFDVVPTVLDLLGEKPRSHISGKSLASSLAAPAQKVQV
ncbi:MAG TPA: alkaline phosphatase family protein [Verrucomicrobiae bacterium]|nr:alkaline phosphatase family protein [Verrucomicrobiae bacterium]